jgi:hypothetical protein
MRYIFFGCGAVEGWGREGGGGCGQLWCTYWGGGGRGGGSSAHHVSEWNGPPKAPLPRVMSDCF